MKPRALALVAVLLGACPSPRAPETQPHPPALATAATASTSIATSTASSSSALPPAPSCLASADVVGWDEAHDEITLCTTKGACVALGVGVPPRATTAPTAPLPDVAPDRQAWSGAEKLVVAGARVQIAGAPKRWAAVPFSTEKTGELLWLSKDGARALVLRIAGPVGGAKPTRDLVDLVDLTKHTNLAHGELCNYEINTDAMTDVGETAAVVSFTHANPVVMVGVIDLVRGKFVQLGTKPGTGYEDCAADDFGTKFVLEQDAALFDATRRIVGRALVSLEGKIVARLEGDFPSGPTAPGMGRERAKAIDANRRVVVRDSYTSGKSTICAGVMHIVPATTDDGPPVAPPRCIATCPFDPGM